MKINKIIKLAELYSYAVSRVYDILDTKRTVDTVCKKINSFLKDNEKINSIDFKLRFAKIAQDKFNQLVATYLKIPHVNLSISELNNRLSEGVNQDDLQFFLHDLIHEALAPQSIKKFKSLDEQFENKKQEILEEVREEREDEYEDGEDQDLILPKYSLDNEVYSLEDFIEEDVAEALTSKNSIAKNGICKYIKLVMTSIANECFDLNLSDSEEMFEEYINESYVSTFVSRVKDRINSDLSKIKNPKYSDLAKKFVKSISHVLDKSEKEIEEKYDIFLNDIVRPVLQEAKNFVGANFGTKEYYSFKEERANPKGEKPVSELTDDFKMSLLRRWVLSLDNEANNLIKRNSGEQLQFNY
jgi:hypothetical protein